MRPEDRPELSPRARRGAELDRKLGVIWSRFWALVVGSAGVALLVWFFSSAKDATLGSAIFITGISVGLLLVARHLWRNKDDLTAILDGVDGPVSQPGRHRD